MSSKREFFEVSIEKVIEIMKDERDKTFKETGAIETNVNIFLGLDDLSMANCVGDLFIKEWFNI